MMDSRTYKIIGAAMEVHRELGCGFLEAVYQEALEREFVIQGVPYQSQPILDIFYKDEPLKKKYKPDFLCYDSIVVEIKALSELTGTDKAQLINYLKSSKIELGLLLNFGAMSLEYQRFISTNSNS